MQEFNQDIMVGGKMFGVTNSLAPLHGISWGGGERTWIIACMSCVQRQVNKQKAHGRAFVFSKLS